MEHRRCRDCGELCDKARCRKCRESNKRVAAIVGSATFDMDATGDILNFGGRYVGGHIVEVRSGRRVVRK